MYFDETGLPWVIPSPNMPTLDTAVVYPGAVLFEGTMLSEGRGTTRPFELIGAPWIDGERLAAAMNARGLPGVHFRPVFFEPTFQKHAQTGLRRLPDPRARIGRAFKPVRTAVELLDEFRRENPARFAGGTLRTNTSTRSSRSTSSPARTGCATTLEAAGTPRSVTSTWASDEDAFRRSANRFCCTGADRLYAFAVCCAAASRASRI